MAVYPATGSILSRADGSNRTGIGLSTQVLITVGPNTVGGLQELRVSEGRTVKFYSEVGTDGQIDSAPTASATVSGSASRIRFDRLHITEAFSRGFLHVKSQRVPFDIVIIDKYNGDGADSLITVIKNVWIKSLGYTFSATDFVIVDSMDWEGEDIFTTLNNGNAATGGERGLVFGKDVYEQEADRGARRGALDGPGLLKAFLPF